MSITRLNPEYQQPLSTESLSSLSDAGITITPKSGWTVTQNMVKRYGNVVFGNLTVKKNVAISADAQDSPFSTNISIGIVSSDKFTGHIMFSALWIRASAAIAANSGMDFAFICVK